MKVIIFWCTLNLDIYGSLSNFHQILSLIGHAKLMLLGKYGFTFEINSYFLEVPNPTSKEKPQLLVWCSKSCTPKLQSFNLKDQRNSPRFVHMCKWASFVYNVAISHPMIHTSTYLFCLYLDLNTTKNYLVKIFYDIFLQFEYLR